MPAETQQHSVRQWWLSLSVGVIYILIGIWTILNPAETYLALTAIFIGGFAIVGVLGVFYAVSNRKKLEHWGWTLMTGLIDLAIAFVLLATPEITEKILPIYIGFVLMFRSIIGIGFSTYLAHFKVRNWGIVLLLSILGVFFSLMMIWDPNFGAKSLVIFTSIALLTVGFAQIGIAYELRRYENLFGDDEGIVEKE